MAAWPATTGCARSPSTSRPNEYLRVRIGIGKPPSKEHGADHVLSRLGKRERELLDESIVVATEAVELIATDGVDAAMRQTN